MTTDTEKRLAEIRERAEKATEGPWNFNQDNNDGVILTIVKTGEHTARYGVIARSVSCDNVSMIAHARSDIPFLLAGIERLTAERDAAWVAGAKAMKKRALGAMEDCVISVNAKGVGVSEACEIVNAVEQQLTAAIRALSPSTLNKPE